jgi:gliding motility-associated-like protein
MASNTVSFCEGTAGTFTFTCIVSGGFNIPTFQWQQRINLGSWTDIPAENTLSLTRSFPAFTPATIFQYRLAVAEAGNMGSPQCRIVSLPLAVEINANPVTTVTNNGPVCEGNALMLTSTGGAQYAWNGPNGFTATGSNVSINNLQLTQAGKYYVIVTNAAGCIHKDSTTIIINPAPAATTGFSNTSICAGDSVQLIAAGGLTYQWIPAEGLSDTDVFNPKASPAGSLQYSAIVTNLFACKDTAYVTVNVLKKPNANAGPDRVMIAGQPIQLSGSVSGEGYNFSWSPANYMDNSHSLQPIVNPPVDIKYILNVVSNFGCGTVSDTMFVKLYNDIFVPNAFSPNGDEINDKWNIPALAAYSSFEVVVYNRYGQIVFQTKNALKPWDGTFNGKPLPVGAYSYFINLGTSRYPLNGTVLIIR